MTRHDLACAIAAAVPLVLAAGPVLAGAATRSIDNAPVAQAVCEPGDCGGVRIVRVDTSGSRSGAKVDPALREDVVALVADTLDVPRATSQTYLTAPHHLSVTAEAGAQDGPSARHVHVFAFLDENRHVVPRNRADVTGDPETSTAFNPCAPLAQAGKTEGATHYLQFSVISAEESDATQVQVILADALTHRVERSAVVSVPATGPDSRAAAMAEAWRELEEPARSPRSGAEAAQPRMTGSDEDCHVRMTVSPEDFTMTHTPHGDYTEYGHPGPESTYIGVDRMAMHDPGGQGWVEFPPEAAAAMRNSADAPGPMDMFDPGEVDESLYMARMPRYLVEALGWERMMANRVRLGLEDDAAIDLDAPCPDGGTGCASLRVELRNGQDAVMYSGRVVYDDMRRVVLLPIEDGHEIAFSYGDFDIGRPPGW